MKRKDNDGLGIELTEKDIRAKKEYHNQKKFFLRKTGFLTNTSKGYPQKCTVRNSFRTPNEMFSESKCKELHKAHIDYMQKEGKGLDGEKPELYGNISQAEYEKNMDSTSWRIILSPENNKMNLNLLTKQFVSRLERITDYKFNWMAANHYDTEHPHTHLLINGIDQNGRKVQLNKKVLTQLMREYASNICTAYLGAKTQSDFEKELDNQTDKEYFTRLDKNLEKKINGNFLNKDYLKDTYSIYYNKRLDYLEKLDLVKYSKEHNGFFFDPEWKAKLQLMGKYNTYYDALKFANGNTKNYALHEIEKNGPVEGKILERYIRQKNSNNFALVIETSSKEIKYVPLPFYPKNCFVGDEVKIQIGNDKKTYIRKTK